MKTLYLVRHAKSSWKYPDLDDFERPLNKRGRSNALFMGKILKKLKVAPDLIISSTTNRAVMTARIIADNIDYSLEKIRYMESIYGAGVDVLIHVIKHIEDSVNHAMLIGHNPELTQLANFIGDYPIGNIPTCGVFCVELDTALWGKVNDRCGKLKFFEFPKKHAS